MKNDKWIQPKESQYIKYISVSEEDIKKAFDVAIKMIENGQTKFIIDAKPLKSSETT